jgi:hypothetical protein
VAWYVDPLHKQICEPAADIFVWYRPEVKKKSAKNVNNRADRNVWKNKEIKKGMTDRKS